MIDSIMLLRYLLETLMLIPGCYISLLPFRKDLRDSSVFGLVTIPVILLSISFIISMICVRYNLTSNQVLLPILPLFFILYSVMIKKRMIKKTFCFVNGVFLSSFCTTYTKYLMAPVERYNPDSATTITSSIVCLALGVAVSIIFTYTVGNKLAIMLSDEQLNPIWKWLLFIPLFLAVLVLWINPDDYNALMNGRIRIISLITLPLLPITALSIYHLFWLLTSRLKENSRLQQENSLLKLEEKRYVQLRDYVDQSRALRHDFRQHLLVISRLAQSKENDKLLEYIAPLLKNATASNKQFCANRTVDAVASHYDDIAESQNTTIEWSLNLPSELPIHDSDVCSILGNFLENALNAVKELPEQQRNVSAAASMLTDETLGISVKNPFQGTIKFRRNGLPRNTKLGHGIGLQSVSMIAQKYHGSLELSASGGVFSAGVLLYTGHTDDGIINTQS